MRSRFVNALDDYLSKIEESILTGSILKAQYLLLKLKKSDCKKKYWLRIADLARRAQMPYFVVLWLNSIVRPIKESDRSDYDPKIITLYANALTRIGSFDEAKNLLKSIDSKDDSQLYFYWALLDMQQWDNKTAIYHLKKYLGQSNLTEYSVKIGKLNLASCLCAVGNYHESFKILLELNESLPPNSLLNANVLEVLGQVLFHKSEFEQSKIYLNQSISVFKQERISYRYYSEKWLIMNDIFSGKKNLNELIQFREKALQSNQWETVRDCDFYRSYFLRDDKLFFSIYFGTRFSKYKDKILEYYKCNEKIPDQFILNPKQLLKFYDEDSKGVNLRISHQGLIYPNNRQIMNGLPLKLFQVLSSDLYQPFHLGELFSKLYPGEYYNPHSSPQKLNRILQRMRLSLKRSEIPIRVRTYKKQTSLDYLSNISLEKNRKNNKILNLEDYYIIKKAYPTEKFSARQVSELLSSSHRTASRLINKLILQKLIIPFNEGPQSKYKLAEG